MASNRKTSAQSAKSAKPAPNRPVSFEMATLVCPTAPQAERVAEKFGLTAPDYEAIRELHARALHDMAGGFASALNDKATQMRDCLEIGGAGAEAVVSRLISDRG